MKVTLLREAGYEDALLGLSLSYNQPLDKMAGVAVRLFDRDGGHNKFLESIVVWLDIVAPRYWWQQFDTYRVGITKQSESTMHTILRKPLTGEDFEGYIPVETLTRLNKLREQKNWEQLKKELPESFLQRRVVCTNYKVLRNMHFQRKDHKLREWQFLFASLGSLLEFPEFLGME